MNLELDGDLATFDGSHDGVRTRASPKLIIAPKSAELALRLAGRLQAAAVGAQSPHQADMPCVGSGPVTDALLREARWHCVEELQQGDSEHLHHL